MQRNQVIYIYTQQKMLQFMYQLPSQDKSNADQRFMSNNTPYITSNILISQIVLMFLFLNKKRELEKIKHTI